MNKSLFGSTGINYNQEMQTLTDRDKIRLIDRVEEKISFSTIDSKFQKSANTSPNRFKGKRFIS